MTGTIIAAGVLLIVTALLILSKDRKRISGRKPCTHCGKCCQEEVCPVGEILLRTTTPPCPALAKDKKGEYWCGLVVCPETAMFAETDYAKYWSRKLGQFLESNVFNFGAGCDRE